MNIHEFETSGEAYDACQIGLVNKGDILVIPSERVIGIADTWPVAVTKAEGKLHGLNTEYTLEVEYPQYAASIKRARALIFEKRWDQSKPKKVRITLTLDEDIVEYFKRIAEADNDRPYQPLMNRVLRDHVDNLTKEE